jgi:hypothetical protein
MPHKIYKIHPDAPDHIARVGLTLKAFAERAGIAESTMHALLNPEQHPHRTRGGMHRTTAWKIARAYASAASVTDEQAYALLIVEQRDDAH